MKVKVNKVTIQIVRDDLLDLPVAAVVSETNTNLNLSPLLLSRAGLGIQRETSIVGYSDVGSAVLTSGGALKASHILHAVTPRWGEGSERGKLSSAVFECLRLCEENKLKSVAFPALGTGANGYPIENCAATMLTQIIDYTFEDLRALRSVWLSMPEDIPFAVFTQELARQVEDLGADAARRG
jgi:O-acetyl-ADP-ribose deacetylase (regulator of RNase III)